MEQEEKLIDITQTIKKPACFDELLAQLVCLPNLPEELCRKTIVEIYYEQAVFNNQIWNNMNQTLFSQLNS